MAQYAHGGQGPYRPYNHAPLPPAPFTPPTPYGAQFPYAHSQGEHGHLADGRGDGSSTGGSPPQPLDHRWAGSQSARLDQTEFPAGHDPSRLAIHRAGSQASALAGYRHQYQPTSPQQQHLPVQNTYNPQDFAHLQIQHHQPGYQSAYAAPTTIHQPYNPAHHARPAVHSPPLNWWQAQGPYLHSSPAQLEQPLSMPAMPPLPDYPPSRPPNSALPAPPSQMPSYRPLAGFTQSSQSAHGPASRLNAAYEPHKQPLYSSPAAPPPPPMPPGLPTLTSTTLNGVPSVSQPLPMPDVDVARQGFHRHDPRRTPRPGQDHEPASSGGSSDSRLSYMSNGSSRPLPSPPAPSPPPHLDQLDGPPGRHHETKPLPTRPDQNSYNGDEHDDPGNEEDWDDMTDEELAQERLWREVQAAVMTSNPASGRPPVPLAAQDDSLSPTQGPRARNHSDDARRRRRINGALQGNGNEVVHDGYDDDDDDDDDDDKIDDDDDYSDAEAAAGLAAMRLAEEEDVAMGARHGGRPLPRPSSSNARGQVEGHEPGDDDSSDGDYANFDVGLYGGGFEGNMSYGNGHFGEPENPNQTSSTAQGLRLSMGQPVEALNDGSSSAYHHYPPPNRYGAHPLPVPPATTQERSERDTILKRVPHGRKLSFENGDEASWERLRGEPSSRQELPEMFYHPGMQAAELGHPLPPVPPQQEDLLPRLVTSEFHSYHSADGRALQSAMSGSVDGQATNPNGLAVPRSSSLSSHPSTPQAVPPVRSKTDAEERKARLLKQQQLGIYSAGAHSEGSLPATAPQTPTPTPLDLPAIPAGKRRRFNPTKLCTADFRLCPEPWALSGIAAWIKDMTEDTTDLKEAAITNGIVALFTHKVPTMNMADAETLAARVVQEMFVAGALVRDEEWVKLGPGSLTGVMWQLTGSGCYAPRVHSQDVAGRCYAHHCSRTLKKINLQAQVLEPQRKLEDWATFHKLTKEDMEKVPRKEVERQNIQHEVVQTEDQYMDQLNVLLCLYRDQLLSSQPPIIQPGRVERFAREVFGKVDGVKRANEDHLLAQLKYRQQEQGPWIVGFSDIFREWVRKAKHAYIEYAASFPHASLAMRKEAERNILFKQFLDQVRDNERSKRLGWDTYLKAPITRLQRYGLLLSTVHKNMTLDTEEKANLQSAIDEIKAVTMECDARVAEMSRKVDLAELSDKLILRPGMQGVELNLNHLGRELIFQGELQRTGANRFTWLDTHALLFDHYLVLAKPIHQKGSVAGLRTEAFDVSKLPIPMDLLALEATLDDPVVKSSVRGISAVSAVSAVSSRTQSTGDLRHNRGTSHQGPGPGTLSHTTTTSSVSTTSSASSGKTMVASTVLEAARDEKLLYPFRVKHLGQDVYTLFAASAQNRQDWCDKILEAKRKHAASLFSQNAEPFRLRVVADTAFACETLSGGPRGIMIRGTPLDRAIREVEKTFEQAGPRPGPSCRATVNCATAFVPLYGKPMVAIGTDFGVYVSNADNPRGWIRVITVSRVTQIAVLEDFSLFLVLADKSLIAYHLDIVCPVSGHQPRNDSLGRAPQKISGNREVGFFATGRMKDRTLVFYKKRDGLSSTFKVLEPVYQKATEKKFRFSRKGTTEFFREFDEFYIPSECFSMDVLRSYLAIATARGFEVLNLDKKHGVGVPDLKPPHVAHLASQLASQRPLGMFRLNNTEFLLAYDECAVYANQHGDVSRSAVMQYVDKARSAAVYGPYLLLFNDDYVEIRNAENGRRRQVIAGRDIKCLDDAQTGTSAGQRTIKFSLQHPEAERTQLVLELVLNDGQHD